MPNCKRCGKPLNNEEFFLCTECEGEELYQEEFSSEDEEYSGETEEDYSYQ